MKDNRHIRTLCEQFGLYDPAFEHDACGVGFVCNIKGQKTNTILVQGLEVLRRLSHRGATGADPKTGDGAGILIQMPHDFCSKVAKAAKITLPGPGTYGMGLVFLPADATQRQACKDVFSEIVKSQSQHLLGWRSVPVNDSCIGITARQTQPAIEQVFIGMDISVSGQLDFERKLYGIRKLVENRIRAAGLTQKSFFYITNLSSRTLSYKGLLMPGQVGEYFLDLKDSSIKSALCLVHSRYSTNTFPTWDLAQPFRFLAHNGEINTLRGNSNWMRARQGTLQSEVFGTAFKELLPVIVPGGSDSAALDNVFELLLLAGRPLAHAMMMLIPEAWEQNKQMDRSVRDFYQYHSCLMESWDGPAAIAVTDGTRIGAVLDRNGLRPARYIVTKDDFVVMASEMGVLDIPPENILSSGRLEPGKIFFIDTEEGCIIQDAWLKSQVSSRKPYGAWIRENIVDLEKLPALSAHKSGMPDIVTALKSFGYSREDLKMIIKPMAETAQEPVGAMGNDAPHALLSNKPQQLYSYFKQLFAQVTNPAIDPIREELVTSLESHIGPEKNLLDETQAHCHKLYVKRPILTNEELDKIRGIKINGFKTKVVSLLFNASTRGSFADRLEEVCEEARQAIAQGYTFIILSDRGTDATSAALPALLAVSAVHHHLVRRSMRTQIGIILESGEPREVHHFALLFGYGVDAVNPYLAYEAVQYLIDEKEVSLDAHKALDNYIKAADKGILKVLSKMGISTLQSYRAAQIFEALGLHQEVIDRYFTGTPSRIGGIDIAIIAQETLLRHAQAFPGREGASHYLDTGGVYQWKRDGEFHLWNPESIAALQDAAREGDYAKYKEFAQLINHQSKNPTTLRSLLKFKESVPVPLDQVEPVSQIVKRFASGAMSFGSISKETHESIAIAMNRLKGRSNTGEGGEDPERFVPLPNGDSKRSAVKQVASGRFGVTTNYLVHADEIQIKICQGAKPGEGGQLPGHKVSLQIAKTRFTTAGVTLISPPPHHDIYSIEDLAQLIFDLKNTNPEAAISVKLVSEIGVGTVAAGVAKSHADKILISGGDGGTGASPLSSIKHAGLPWELGISEAHQTLVLNDLRSRVRLQTDGQMRTGRDTAIAALLGAEEFGFCTAILVVLGCVMLRHCNLNNCSVGVATQDEILRARFRGNPDHIENYLRFVAQELREIMSSLGIKKVDDMIGRTDLLELDRSIAPWKAQKIDYSRMLYKPEVPASVGTHCTVKQDHALGRVLDLQLISLAKTALEYSQPVKIELPIKNVNRATGAMLSGRVCARFGEEALPEGTIHCKFTGVAGQSFGAWLAQGVTFELEGMANDYVGKGISGGKIIVYPDKRSDFKCQENILIGNTAFYGAIRGQAYIRGMAGERFCIRNSGLFAVVEGVGDHACEYMTGGRVVVLGATGRNFAAGMSGGIAYVYDPKKEFAIRCNQEMVELSGLSSQDIFTVGELLRNHCRYTKSSVAEQILDDFHAALKCFVRVLPLEYKRIIETQTLEKAMESAEDTE